MLQEKGAMTISRIQYRPETMLVTLKKEGFGRAVGLYLERGDSLWWFLNWLPHLMTCTDKRS
jgi:hypothetical protein